MAATWDETQHKREAGGRFATKEEQAKRKEDAHKFAAQYLGKSGKPSPTKAKAKGRAAARKGKAGPSAASKAWKAESENLANRREALSIQKEAGDVASEEARQASVKQFQADTAKTREAFDKLVAGGMDPEKAQAEVADGLRAAAGKQAARTKASKEADDARKLQYAKDMLALRRASAEHKKKKPVTSAAMALDGTMRGRGKEFYLMAETEYTEKDPFAPVGGRAIRAGGFPVKPPSIWFQNPNLNRPTPLQITADGYVAGHIAGWSSRHIGLPGNVPPPKSSSDYAYFKTGVIETAEGEQFDVGQLTLSGGHAPLSADAGTAVSHYDDTASAIADLNVGEDEHGIWVAGALRPGVSDEQVRAVRASAPSGDWRPIGRGLELVALCQVSVPGFPLARARVASGKTLALVAAGAADLYRVRLQDMVRDAGPEVVDYVHESHHWSPTYVLGYAAGYMGFRPCRDIDRMVPERPTRLGSGTSRSTDPRSLDTGGVP